MLIVSVFFESFLAHGNFRLIRRKGKLKLDYIKGTYVCSTQNFKYSMFYQSRNEKNQS